MNAIGKGNTMNTISDNVLESELVIKKSKFITFLYIVRSKKDVLKYLKEISLKYQTANHICYAYIINNEKKYTDDNEPSKTAGFPMLNILEKKKLNYVLAVVVRFFGGIKLGANGLIRAYMESVKLALEKTNIVFLEEKTLIVVITNYDKVNTVLNILKNEEIINKKFDDKIIIDVLVKRNNVFDICNTFDNLNISYNVKDKS